MLGRLREELTPLAFESWIAPLVAESTDAGLHLLCPTAFHCERVRERFLERIERYVAAATDGGLAVTLGVRVGVALPHELGRPARPREGAPARVQPLAAAPRAATRGERPAPASPPEPVRRGEPPRLDFAGFVVGASNALAREACLALAQGRQLPLNPLYLVAGPGMGKTHLASAVVHEARARGETPVYVSAEQFTNELMAAIRTQRTAELKRRYRELPDVLVFEDVHFLRGKRQTQLELLHTLEHLDRRGARVLLTAERLPREIPDLDPRLASRLASGLCAEIEPPDVSLRRDLLRVRAEALGARLPQPCIERLADAVAGNVRDLEAAVVQIVASASLLRRRIDLDLVEAALRKLVPRAGGSALGPERIAEIVAAHFHTTPTALASRSRRRDVLLPRQIAMYLCTRYTDESLQRIARVFGRNHPAVANAVRTVERGLAARPALRERVDRLVAEIESLVGGRKGPRRAPPRRPAPAVRPVRPGG